MGESTGSFLAQHVAGKQTNIVALPGPASSGWAEQFAQGLKKAVAANKHLRLVDEKFGDTGVAVQLRLVQKRAAGQSRPERALGQRHDDRGRHRRTARGQPQGCAADRRVREPGHASTRQAGRSWLRDAVPGAAGRIAVDLAIKALQKEKVPSFMAPVPAMVTTSTCRASAPRWCWLPPRSRPSTASQRLPNDGSHRKQVRQCSRTSRREPRRRPHVPRIHSFRIVKTFPGCARSMGWIWRSLPARSTFSSGENGAGKSTIINIIIAGVLRPDGGSYAYEGKAVSGLTLTRRASSASARCSQEFSLVPELTVEQNIFLGREPVRAGFIDRRRMRGSRSRCSPGSASSSNRRRASAGCPGPSSRWSRSPGGALQRQGADPRRTNRVAHRRGNPERLFELVGELRQTGVSIIYVSHRMREISRIADRITVLRDGRRIATVHNHEVTDAQLIELMTGRKIDILFPPVSHKPGAVMLRTQA